MSAYPGRWLISIYAGHVQVLSMLVKAGQDPELEDSYGQTPLHLAALRGNMDAAEFLIMEVYIYIYIVPAELFIQCKNVVEP